MKLHGHIRAEEVATKLQYVKLAVEKDVVASIKTELEKVDRRIKVGEW